MQTIKQVGLDEGQVGAPVLLKDFMYLVMRHTETQAEGAAAGSLREPVRDSIPGPGITPWAEGRRSAAGPPGRPSRTVFIFATFS